MKRFYCSICKRVKRVHTLPHIISAVDSANPRERIGTCNRHVEYRYQSNRSIKRSK